jgi:hypothetical protein
VVTSACLRQVSGDSVVFTSDVWPLTVFSWFLEAYVVFPALFVFSSEFSTISMVFGVQILLKVKKMIVL